MRSSVAIHARIRNVDDAQIAAFCGNISVDFPTALDVKCNSGIYYHLGFPDQGCGDPEQAARSSCVVVKLVGYPLAEPGDNSRRLFF